MSAPGEFSNVEQPVVSEFNPELGLVVKEESEIQKIVDVAVLMDGTGSMGYEMQAAAETMVSNVKILKSKYPNCVFRVAFVVYRDYDEPNEFVITEFTENVEELVSKLTKERASGGNDACENVAGGLARLLDLLWKGDICQVFWVADAPAHGDRYHTASVSDNHRDGDRNGLDPEELFRRLARKNIGVSFFKMNSTTDKMIDVLDAAYQGARIPGNKANFIVADVSVQLSEAKAKAPHRVHYGGFDVMPAMEAEMGDEPYLMSRHPELNLFQSPSAEAYSEQFLAAVSSQMADEE